MNTVTLTVTDQSDNSNAATATVTVEDSVNPMITCPLDLIEEINGGTFTLPDYFTDGLVTASDNCDFTVEQFHLPGTELMPGSFEISFTVTDGFGNTDACFFNLKVNDATLNLDNFNSLEKNIRLFPNPTIDNFSIENKSGLQLNPVEIIDITEKRIIRINLESTQALIQVSMEGYATGIYIVKINTSNRSVIKRIVKR